MLSKPTPLHNLPILDILPGLQGAMITAITCCSNLPPLATSRGHKAAVKAGGRMHAVNNMGVGSKRGSWEIKSVGGIRKERLVPTCPRLSRAGFEMTCKFSMRKIAQNFRKYEFKLSCGRFSAKIIQSFQYGEM